MSLPPDLRVLCRRLASTKPEDLAPLSPILVNHVLRCGAPLSAPHETKSKDRSSEGSVFVYKLKTQINTLLNGRTPSGRFTAVALVKAIVDVGGWECLRASEPWVRGLLAVLQKPDPLACKELCIVTLVRIYTLLHGYQTLVREIVTPTLPAFVTACLQLIKPPAAGRPPRVPASFTESVACALSTIIPLYPTTLRPFASQIRSTFRGCLAPTSSDPFITSQTLRNSARGLVILLHYTAPKNSSSDEWAGAVANGIKDCHATASLVFRAVQEYWESTTGYNLPTVSYDEEIQGGSDSAEDLPPWSGLQAGAERLIGILELLADYFHSPTKAAVTVPLAELMDLVLRLTLIAPPSSEGQEEGLQTNAAIGREEKAELWSVLPDIHAAAMQLHFAMIQRLGRGVLPFANDMLDQIVRAFGSASQIPSIRAIAYTVTAELLVLTGPTLTKMAVGSMTAIIQNCCRDILQAAGHLQEDKSQSAPTNTNGSKLKEGSHNADSFLTPQASTAPIVPTLAPDHLAAATKLLAILLSDLPQTHLAPELRGLLDRTAILSNNKDAMLASCLHPYKDKNGRYYPSILPFLVQQFPHDQGVEVLRANLRGAARGPQESWDPETGVAELLREPDEDTALPTVGHDDPESPDNGIQDESERHETGATGDNGWPMPESSMEVDSVPTENPFMTNQADVIDPEHTQPQEGPSEMETTVSITLKRKGSEIDSGHPKRFEKGKDPEVPIAQLPARQQIVQEAQEDGESDSDSGGSIEIDPTFDSDVDEEEEEEEEGDNPEEQE